MAQVSITENLEGIMRQGSSFPFDARITQIFTNTVNVKPIGSRTILRDVALPDHIKAADLQIGYPVRLGMSGSNVIVLAVFEQFADEESINYAGLGSRMPGKPIISVAAMADGWHVKWPKVTDATKYRVYANDGSDGDSPELIATIPATLAASYDYAASYRELEAPFRYFAVQAWSGLLEGDVSLWLTDETPPLSPAWVSDTFQGDGHYLRWSHPIPADVATFILYRNTSPVDAGAIEVLPTTKLSAIAPYSNEGNYFGIQAIDYSGLNQSPIVWSPLYNPAPATPGNFLANMVEGGGFVCTWYSSAWTMLYEIEGATDDQGTNATKYWSGVALTTPTLLKTGVIYFRVRSVGFDGSTSAWTNWQTDSNPPPQPAIQVTSAIRSVIIGLTASDTSHNAVGFSHYKLEMADGSSGQNATVVDSHAVFGVFPVVMNLVTGLTKYFRLTPYDWAGNAGTYTNWTAGTPLDEGATVKDKFDTFGGLTSTPVESLYWLGLTDFDTDETWVYGQNSYAAISDTVNLLEGNRAIKLTNSPAGAYSVSRTVTYNLQNDSRMGANDWLVGSLYVYSTFTGQAYDLQIMFYSGPSSYFAAIQPISNVTGWQHFSISIQNLQTVGTPAWNNITEIVITAFLKSGSGTRPDITIDRLRLSKHKPSTIGAWDDTGENWLFTNSNGSMADALWHILPGNRTSEPSKPFNLAQLVTVASPGYTQGYLAYKPNVDIKVGTIQVGVFHKFNGKSGLAFFISNTTQGHWTFYAVEIDNVADTVKLARWQDGTRTELASASFAFVSAGGTGAGQTVWIGADFSDYYWDGGRIKVYASTVEGNLIQAGNLKISVQDNVLGAGGSVGLISYETGVRFVNFVAGSPAHAELADVSKALDGVIIAGDVRRVQYNRETNNFEYSDDGLNWNPVGGAGNLVSVDDTDVADYLYPKLKAGADIALSEYTVGPGYKQVQIDAGSNLFRQTSTNRPGPTRLYRRDVDSNYSVQTHYDGSRWFLRGYNASDVFHAECRVGYADAAGSAPPYNHVFGVNLGSNTGINKGAWYNIAWSSVHLDSGGVASWSSGSPSYVTITDAGTYVVTLGATTQGASGANGNLTARVLVNDANAYPGIATFPQYLPNTNYTYGMFTLVMYISAGSTLRFGVYWNDANYNATLQANWTRAHIAKV